MIRLGYILHLRSGIGDGDKSATRLVCANGLLYAIEEVLLENIWLKRRA